MSDAYDRDGRLRTRDDVWELLLPGGLRRELSAVLYVREWREMMARASILDRALHLLLTLVFLGGLALSVMSTVVLAQGHDARYEDAQREASAIDGVRRELAALIQGHVHVDYPTRDELQTVAMWSLGALVAFASAIGGLAHKAQLGRQDRLGVDLRELRTAHYDVAETVAGLVERGGQDHEMLKRLVESADEARQATRELVDLTRRRMGDTGGDDQ